MRSRPADCPSRSAGRTTTSRALRGARLGAYQGDVLLRHEARQPAGRSVMSQRRSRREIRRILWHVLSFG